MKKFITIFPIIVILIMSNMVGIYAHGASVNGEIFIASSWSDESVSLDKVGCGLTDFISYHDVSDDQYYVYFEDMTLYVERSGYNIYNLYSYFMYFDLDKIESSEYDSEADCYTLQLTTGRSMYYAGTSMTILTGSDIFDDDSLPAPSIANNNTVNSSVDCVKYYPTESKIELYYNGVLKSTREDIKNFQSNCDNVPSLGLDLTVTFNPSLSGQVIRTINQNGVEAESNYFSMDITNNSSKGVQFAMAIVNSGDKVNISSILSVNGQGLYNKSMIYCLAYKDWYYVYANHAVQKVYGLCTWHYIDSKSTYHRNFSWSQMNLEQGKYYDVVVWAIPNDYGCSSAVNNSKTNNLKDNGLLFENLEEVYRSTFTMLNPSEFDINDDSFGNVYLDPNDSSPKFDFIEGYVDPMTGDTVIGDYELFGEDSPFGNVSTGGGGGGYRYDSYSFSSFINSSHQYLSFLSSAFGFFPAWLWGTISLGFFTIIIVGVIKRLG